MMNLILTTIGVLTLSTIIYFYIKRQNRIKKKIQDILSIKDGVNEAFYAELDDDVFVELKTLIIHTNMAKLIGLAFSIEYNIYLGLDPNIMKRLTDIEQTVNANAVEIYRIIFHCTNFNNNKVSMSKRINKLNSLYKNKVVSICNGINMDVYGEYIPESLSEEKFKKEVCDIKDLMKECNIYLESGLYNKLNKSFDVLAKRLLAIEIALDIPTNLCKKIEMNSNNLNSIIGDIDNRKGSLYKTVYTIIKDEDISPEQINKWNGIKNDINITKKTYLSQNEYDVIYVNYVVSELIEKMVELEKELDKEIKNEQVSQDR